MEENYMDIEDLLELFFVRRFVPECSEVEPPKHRTNGTNIENSLPVFEYIPLLLCDIKHLNPTESSRPKSFTCSISNGAISFRSCIVHARIVNRLNGNKIFHKYVIDDGTATLQMNVVQRQKVIQKICHLRGEVDALITHSRAQDAEKMASCLRRLLNLTIKQVDTSDFTLGSKVLVYGQLNCYRGSISFDAFNIWRCTLTRDVEIAFKDYLIYWYSTKYPALIQAT